MELAYLKLPDNLVIQSYYPLKNSPVTFQPIMKFENLGKIIDDEDVYKITSFRGDIYKIGRRCRIEEFETCLNYAIDLGYELITPSSYFEDYKVRYLTMKELTK